ncbi:uncharacterized protein BDR25DRAFT_387217 [Lindgomyces ingoldianus]|uniref:Uncharacterized protein n=1 Tax=Lindgomyces ingoldianus TaxID=673940 RepID=A0ACB6R1Y2_9PLEO|nr:uncharacterized protein BDR25DRAFT_387217 [Lindgomyces ingoldianus]KAF2473100.1 hypothetical protein BDR25DRAFT_387217 [Lindgomyces ingoldianus]
MDSMIEIDDVIFEPYNSDDNMSDWQDEIGLPVTPQREAMGVSMQVERLVDSARKVLVCQQSLQYSPRAESVKPTPPGQSDAVTMIPGGESDWQVSELPIPQETEAMATRAQLESFLDTSQNVKPTRSELPDTPVVMPQEDSGFPCRNDLKKDDLTTFIQYQANQKTYEAAFLKTFVTHALHPSRLNLMRCLPDKPEALEKIEGYLRAVSESVDEITTKIIQNAHLKSVNFLAKDGSKGLPFINIHRSKQDTFKDFGPDNIFPVAQKLKHSWHKAWPNRSTYVQYTAADYPVSTHSPFADIAAARKKFDGEPGCPELPHGHPVVWPPKPDHSALSGIAGAAFDSRATLCKARESVPTRLKTPRKTKAKPSGREVVSTTASTFLDVDMVGVSAGSQASGTSTNLDPDITLPDRESRRLNSAVLNLSAQISNEAFVSGDSARDETQKKGRSEEIMEVHWQRLVQSSSNQASSSYRPSYHPSQDFKGVISHSVENRVLKAPSPETQKQTNAFACKSPAKTLIRSRNGLNLETIRAVTHAVDNEILKPPSSAAQKVIKAVVAKIPKVKPAQPVSTPGIGMTTMGTCALEPPSSRPQKEINNAWSRIQSKTLAESTNSQGGGMRFAPTVEEIGTLDRQSGAEGLKRKASSLASTTPQAAPKKPQEPLLKDPLGKHKASRASQAENTPSRSKRKDPSKPEKPSKTTPSSGPKLKVRRPKLTLVKPQPTGPFPPHPSGSQTLEPHQVLPQGAYFEAKGPEDKFVWRCGINHALGYYYNSGDRKVCPGCFTHIEYQRKHITMDFYMPIKTFSRQPAPDGVIWKPTPIYATQRVRTTSENVSHKGHVSHNGVAKLVYWEYIQAGSTEAGARQKAIEYMEEYLAAKVKPESEPTPEPESESEDEQVEPEPHPSGSKTMEHGQELPLGSYWQKQERHEEFAWRCDSNHALGRYYLAGDKRTCPGCGSNKSGKAKHATMDFYMEEGTTVRQTAENLVDWQPRRPYKTKSSGKEKKVTASTHNQYAAKVYWEAVDNGRTAAEAMKLALDKTDAWVDAKDAEVEAAAVAVVEDDNGSREATIEECPDSDSDSDSAVAPIQLGGPDNTKHKRLRIVPKKRAIDEVSIGSQYEEGPSQNRVAPNQVVESSDDDISSSGSDSE